MSETRTDEQRAAVVAGGIVLWGSLAYVLPQVMFPVHESIHPQIVPFQWGNNDSLRFPKNESRQQIEEELQTVAASNSGVKPNKIPHIAFQAHIEGNYKLVDLNTIHPDTITIDPRYFQTVTHK